MVTVSQESSSKCEDTWAPRSQNPAVAKATQCFLSRQTSQEIDPELSLAGTSSWPLPLEAEQPGCTD